MRSWRHAVVLLLAMVAAAPAQAQEAAAPLTQTSARDANLRAYLELLRSDIRTQKVAIITEILQFSEEEDARFWPIYREYEVELARINDDRLKLIAEYAQAYEHLTNEVADRLAAGALALEGQRHALKEKYYARIRSALPAATALKFFQVENQILLLLDLQIAASLPIVR